MLDNPSDYEFLDVSNVQHYIDGKFIPTVNPESKTALLFYEAYLFMLEAWYERMNIDSTGTRSISPKAAPTLLKSSLIGIPLQFYSVGNASKASIRGPRLDKAADYASYISEDTVVSDGFVEWYSSTPKKGVDSMLSKYTLKCYESSSPYYSMLYDQRLLSDFIRCKLWELNSMRKAIFLVKTSSFCTSATQRTLKPDGSIKSDVAINIDNYYESLTVYWWTDNLQYGTYQSQALLIDYRDSFIWTLPHAISATIIWSVTVDRNTALNDRGVVWGKMAAAVADGKIAVESGFIDSIATQALTTAGIGVGVSNTRAYSPRIWLLVDFDFPANLDGSQWSWTPD